MNAEALLLDAAHLPSDSDARTADEGAPEAGGDASLPAPLLSVRLRRLGVSTTSLPARNGVAFLVAAAAVWVLSGVLAAVLAGALLGRGVGLASILR